MNSSEPRHLFEVATGTDGHGATDPIDLKFLRRYTLGKADLEREVLRLFCEHAPAMLAALKGATAETAWRQAAHTIKGSALSLGAWRLARIAEQAESASGQFADAASLLVSIEHAIEEARSFIANLDLSQWPCDPSEQHDDPVRVRARRAR